VKTTGEKIQKVLAAAGFCSRRGAEDLIRRGQVRVNGAVVDNPAIRVDPERDQIECEGRRLEQQKKARPRVLILFKTVGTVTSSADPHNPETVYSLLPEDLRDRRWVYVGRLDKDSEGLLLFTDSGELAHRLTHPSFKVDKQYRVKIGGKIEPTQIRSLLRGLTIEGRSMRMDRVRVLWEDADRTTLEIVLHQGEKRQIRRMLARLGLDVLSLCRTKFGPLTLGALRPGECRELNEKEIKKLLKASEAQGEKRQKK
jgi:23S rRNA pseudouridine2605 synthase